MKIIFWHVDYIKYKAIQKALKSAPENVKKEDMLKNGVVVLISFEIHDDVQVVEKLIKDLNDYSEKIGVDSVMVYPYAHLSNDLLNPRDSITLMEYLINRLNEENRFKVIKSSPFGWYKELEVKVKGHPLAELSRSF